MLTPLSIKKVNLHSNRTPMNRDAASIDSSDFTPLAKENTMLGMGKQKGFLINQAPSSQKKRDNQASNLS